MIASGSQEFCEGAASRYREKHPDRETTVIEHTKLGPPADWNREEEETDAEADQ